MEVERRPVHHGETERFRQIHHAAYREAVEAQFGRWDEAEQDRYFLASWDAAHEAVLVDGALAGYCSIERREGDIHVRELVIEPAFQNRGVGTTIVTETIHEAHERFVPIVLATLIANRAANLYERLGFSEFDRTDTHRLFRWSP